MAVKPSAARTATESKTGAAPTDRHAPKRPPVQLNKEKAAAAMKAAAYTPNMIEAIAAQIDRGELEVYQDGGSLLFEPVAQPAPKKSKKS